MSALIDTNADMRIERFFRARDLGKDAFGARFADIFAPRVLRIPEDRRLRAYIGANLSRHKYRVRNGVLRSCLAQLNVDTYLPQEDGGLVTEMVKDGVSIADAKRDVFRLDAWALDQCDLYIGARWPPRPDEGECWEHGCAWAWKKACVAIVEEESPSLRGAGNPMLMESLIHEPFPSVGTLCAWLQREMFARRVV